MPWHVPGHQPRLLDTALGVMNTAAHQYVGEMLHDRISGALELCCRRRDAADPELARQLGHVPDRDLGVCSAARMEVCSSMVHGRGCRRYNAHLMGELDSEKV